MSRVIPKPTGGGIPVSEKGAPNGVAELDGTGLVPVEELPPVHASSLAGLSDVDLTSPANNDLLSYDDVEHKWINANPPVVPDFATNEETASGASLVKIVNPNDLKYMLDRLPPVPVVPDFASNEETASGASLTKIVNPSGLKYTLDLLPPVPIFATNDETYSGASSTKIVNPSGLKYTLDLRIPDFASNEETASGASLTKMVNPSGLKYAMSQPVYDIDSLPIGWAIDGSVAPGVVTVLTSTNSVRYRDFSGAANNDVFFEWVVPYDIDTDIKPKFQVEGWITNATPPVAAGIIAFSLAGASYGDGDLLSGALGTPVLITKVFSGTPARYDRFVIDLSEDLTITDLAPGELVIFSLVRLIRYIVGEYAQAIGVSWLKIKYAKVPKGS
jgi:hypothetical protein